MNMFAMPKDERKEVLAYLVQREKVEYTSQFVVLGKSLWCFDQKLLNTKGKRSCSE